MTQLHQSAMGTFTVDCNIINPVYRDRSRVVTDVLVDSGSELSWIPREVLEELGIPREKKDETFTMANGQTLTRSVGFAIVRVGDRFTNDEVVFGEPEDLPILGARSLEGMNLRVDPALKRLVSAGPILAAAAAEGGTWA